MCARVQQPVRKLVCLLRSHPVTHELSHLNSSTQSCSHGCKFCAGGKKSGQAGLFFFIMGAAAVMFALLCSSFFRTGESM